MPARYAVYYAPPAGGELEAFGERWLGRNAAGEGPAPPPALPGFEPERLETLTREPRRYGFHASLKTPFRLARGQTIEALAMAVEAVARAHVPFEAPPLKLGVINGFIALVPEALSLDLNRLAADCVRELDRFRAPLTPLERARRRVEVLTARQEWFLKQWGDPHVFEEFRFHMTLTRRIERRSEREALLAALEPQVAPLRKQPLPVKEICLFVQPEELAPFVLAGRFAFAD